MDILIFAIIAAFLIYRLNAVLGAKHGNERQRSNPFTPPEPAAAVQKVTSTLPPRVAPPPQNFDQIVDSDANKDGRIEQGLADIVSADPQFEISEFVAGARYAFELIVMAYARGDLETLKPLLSPKLYNDFAAGVRARDAAGHVAELIIHRIKGARITEAHMGGAMAYMTVALEVEETAVTRDAAGQVAAGSADHIITINDVWTFTRDTRLADPNWILIETRASEQ